MALTVDKEDWRIAKKDGKFLRVITASAAKKTLKKDKARGRFPKKKSDYLTVVDGRLFRVEERVRFGGKIKYHNNTGTMAEALVWIALQLVRKSPWRAKNGRGKAAFRRVHYEDAHLYMVDGRSVMTVDKQTNIVALERTYNTVKHTKNSKHVFINTMPYARRIEHGGGFTHTTKDRLYKKGKKAGQLKKGRTRTLAWSMDAPNGVYRLVAKEAKLRFGESMRITYTRLQISLPYSFMTKKGLVKQFYPAIVVRAKKGITKGVTRR